MLRRILKWLYVQDESPWRMKRRTKIVRREIEREESAISVAGVRYSPIDETPFAVEVFNFFAQL